MQRRTIINILIILVVLSFFVTPLGYEGKVLLNRIFSFSPEEIPRGKRDTLAHYDWKLKDADWNFINFRRSEGKVVFINLWASWRLPSAAELKSVQELYDRYHDRVDFYIITNEEREPVEAFMEENGFRFPVSYLIIGEETPVETESPPRSYIIDKRGVIVVDQEGIADWDNKEIYGLLDRLLEE